MAIGRRRTRRRVAAVSGTRKYARRKTARRAYVPVARRRRRSVGAIKGFDFQKIAGLMVGGIAGKYVSNLLPAGTGKTIADAAKVAAGLFLPQLVKGQNKFLTAVGDGMIVDGTTGLVEGFAPGVFSGIGNMYSIDTARMDGIPMLAGSATQIEKSSETAGVPIIAGINSVQGLARVAELAGE